MSAISWSLPSRNACKALTERPSEALATLPALPPIGHWHSQNFMAAIAPAQRIVAAQDQAAQVETFLQTAVDAAIKALK